jgi:hypothetical protein
MDALEGQHADDVTKKLVKVAPSCPINLFVLSIYGISARSMSSVRMKIILGGGFLKLLILLAL